MANLSSKLETENGEFNIGCIYDKNFNVVKDMVWFEFAEIEAGIKDRPDIKIIWDATEYLIKTFYPYLQHYRERTISYLEKEEFKDIEPHLTDEKVEDIIELFETAIKLKWFDV